VEKSNCYGCVRLDVDDPALLALAITAGFLLPKKWGSTTAKAKILDQEVNWLQSTSSNSEVLYDLSVQALSKLAGTSLSHGAISSKKRQPIVDISIEWIRANGVLWIMSMINFLTSWWTLQECPSPCPS
jgi:hypothetical protein